MPHKGYKKPLMETAAWRRAHGKQVKFKNGKVSGQGNPHPTMAKVAQETYAFKPTKADMPSSIDIKTLSPRHQREILSFFDTDNNGNNHYTPEELRNAIVDYAAHVMKANEDAPTETRSNGQKYKKISWIPTLQGFYVYAHMPVGTLNYLAEKPEYANMISAFRAWCEAWTAEEMLKSKVPAIPAIFTLKAYYGRVEPTAPQEINVHKDSMNESDLQRLFAPYKEKVYVEEQQRHDKENAKDVEVNDDENN